jgi:hypothetical protein
MKSVSGQLKGRRAGLRNRTATSIISGLERHRATQIENVGRVTVPDELNGKRCVLRQH